MIVQQVLTSSNFGSTLKPNSKGEYGINIDNVTLVMNSNGVLSIASSQNNNAALTSPLGLGESTETNSGLEIPENE